MPDLSNTQVWSLAHLIHVSSLALAARSWSSFSKFSLVNSGASRDICDGTVVALPALVRGIMDGRKAGEAGVMVTTIEN